MMKCHSTVVQVLYSNNNRVDASTPYTVIEVDIRYYCRSPTAIPCRQSLFVHTVSLL